MAPREADSVTNALVSTLPLLLLGFVLSMGFTWLVALLITRMNMYRRARDRARAEMAAREEAQDRLSRSEARYRSVFDSVTDGLFVMEREGRIVEANDAACLMHGFEPDGLNGTQYQELIEPSRRHLWIELKQQLESREPVRYQSKHLRKDGAVIEVEVRGTTFDIGKEPLFVVILTDVTEQLRAQRRQAILSRKVLVAQEEERARIARELHDELGQLLTALRFELGWLKKQGLKQSEEAENSFEGAIELVETAADELRGLCRGLRPPLLDDLGLEPAVRQLVNKHIERSNQKIELQIDVGFDGEIRANSLPMELALVTYRILQESLTNINRHSNARTVKISLDRNATDLVMTVVDDGCGFDVSDLGEVEGCGIEGMKERAALVRGELEIDSAAHRGTQVVFKAPLDGAER